MCSLVFKWSLRFRRFWSKRCMILLSVTCLKYYMPFSLQFWKCHFFKPSFRFADQTFVLWLNKLILPRQLVLYMVKNALEKRVNSIYKFKNNVTTQIPSSGVCPMEYLLLLRWSLRPFNNTLELIKASVSHQLYLRYFLLSSSYERK